MIGAIGAGAGLGAAKYFLNDKDQEKRDRQTQAEIARYSPWTGMAPQNVQSASLFNDTLQGATMGTGLGQNITAADQQEAMQGKQGGLLDAQTAYYNNLAQQQQGYPSAQKVSPPPPPPQPLAQQGSAGAYNRPGLGWTGMNTPSYA